MKGQRFGTLGRTGDVETEEFWIRDCGGVFDGDGTPLWRLRMWSYQDLMGDITSRRNMTSWADLLPSLVCINLLSPPVSADLEHEILAEALPALRAVIPRHLLGSWGTMPRGWGSPGDSQEIPFPVLNPLAC
jgi:hypothetical protein